MGDQARAKWDAVAPLLAGVVRPRDVPVLVVLTTWLTLADRTARAVEEMDAADKKYAQMLTCYAIATDKILSLSSRFGLTPADRAKLHAAMPKTAPTKPKVATRPRTSLDSEGAPPA